MAELPLLERRLVEKLGMLGIDEKHEFLLNSVPLYRKITLALIPPLQSSLSFIDGLHDDLLNGNLTDRIDKDPDDPDLAELAGNNPKSESTDDYDAAHPIGEDRALNSFLNVLATALVYAGVTSFNNIRQLCESSQLRCWFEFKEPPAGYQVFEEASETSETEDESIRKTTRVSTRAGSEEPRIFQLPLCDKMFDIPPAHERTGWQNSVLKNLDMSPNKDVLITEYKDGEIEETTQNNAERFAMQLANKAKIAFDLSDDDYLYANFDAWLIRDVLVQGHLYLTREAVCFYSLLPSTTTETANNVEDSELTLYSGVLGLKMAQYGDSYFTSVATHRFWGILKPQTLSIYSSPTELYFPTKVIDLKTALRCEIIKEAIVSSPGSGIQTPRQKTSPRDTVLLRSPSEQLLSQLGSETSSIAEAEDVEPTENMQSGVWFKIVCTNTTYRFHTGNVYSARHWCNSITKVIFELHNATAQREVLLKIPYDDLLDYQKNFVLADVAPSEITQDNETPITFSLKYSLPLSEPASTLQKLKNKTGKTKTGQPGPYDFVHLLLLQRGEDFTTLFSQIYHDNSKTVVDDSLNQRFKRKAKWVFGDDSSDASSVSSKRSSQVLSTLQPEFTSTNSLVDKVAAVNEKILQQRTQDRREAELGEDDFGTSSEPPAKKRTMSKLLNVKKNIFKSGTRSLDSIPATLEFGAVWDNEKPLSEHLSYSVDEWGIVNFPKPFSVMTLKKLNMRLVTSKRKIEDVERRYNNMERHRRTLDISVSLFLIGETMREGIENGDDDQLTNPKSLEGQSLNGPPLRRKNSKMKSFKRSLKTVSSMGGVWSASPYHFEKEAPGDSFYVADLFEREVTEKHFRKHFSLSSQPKLVATYYAHLRRSMPVYGKLYLGDDKLCFRSLLPGVSTKMILPLKDVEACSKENGIKLKYSGLIITMQGMDKLVLEFGTLTGRDDCQKMILRQLEIIRGTNAWAPQPHEWGQTAMYRDHRQIVENVDIAAIEKLRVESRELALARVRRARLRLLEDRISVASGIEFPLILDDNLHYFTEVKPANSYNFTLLTIGSRGDVQPYIALGKGLMEEGHNVTIATHLEFREWILKHGLQFKEIAGNPAELMSLMVTHGSMSVGFLKEASSKFRGWINELLSSSWEACQGTDILIESPSAMGGIHIAEALGIPYMRAFTMPWTRTRAYPHAFIVPDHKRGGSYNFLTHVMFENVFWKGISSQVNKWRVELLELPRTNLVKMQQSRIPFLYNLSPAMFPPAVDFPDWVNVTGYWFLDEGTVDYEPPAALVAFLEEAKEKKEKVVYIGFGSIVVSDARSLTKAVVDAVLDLGVRCILNKGWSDRLSKSKNEIEVELPPQIFDSGAVPHDWLFPRIDAAVHHGGSGTIGATLRAGLPTIVKPFFGDQFFYASRVEELGIGLALKNLNAKSLTKALKAITDAKYLEKAKTISQAMEHETGVLDAIAAIYNDLAYSKSLMMTMRINNEQRKTDDKSGMQTPVNNDENFKFGDDEDDDKGDDSDGSDDDSDDSDEALDEELEVRDAGSGLELPNEGGSWLNYLSLVVGRNQKATSGA